MNKLEIIRKLQSKDPETSFIANVILTQQRKPAKRLTGLLAILECGENDACMSRDGQLYINGNPLSWTALELPLAQIEERIPLRRSAEGGAHQ